MSLKLCDISHSLQVRLVRVLRRVHDPDPFTPFPFLSVCHEYVCVYLDQKFADSILALGAMYEQGEGVEKDENKACELYSRAVELNNPYGQFVMAFHYLEGTGVEKDSERGWKLLTMSADQGFTGAEVLLGAYCTITHAHSLSPLSLPLSVPLNECKTRMQNDVGCVHSRSLSLCLWIYHMCPTQ